jgi:O-antigen/teichoic acid export membrane protein
MTEAGAATGRVGRDAFWSLLYLVGIRAGTFALSIIAARMFGARGIGEFGVAIQLASLASLVGGMNLASAVARALPAAPSNAVRRAVLYESAGAVGLGGLLVGGGLALFAPLVAARAYGDPGLAPVLVATGVFAAASAFYVWAEGTLQGLRWFRWQARWGVAVALADLGLGSLAALRDLTTMLVVRAGVRVAAVGLLLGSIARWLRRTDTADGGDGPVVGTLRRLFAFAGPSLIANVIALAGLAWMRALVTRSAGVVEAGYYQSADSVAQGLALVPLAAAMAMLPAVAHAATVGYPNFGGTLGRALRRVTGFNLPLCLAIAGTSAWLPGFVFGRALAPASPALAGLAAASGMIGLATTFGAAVVGRGEIWSAVLLNGTWALALAALLLSGAPPVSAFAATGAVGGAYLVLLVLYVGIALRRWKVDVRTVAAPILMNVGAWLAILAAWRFAAALPWLPALVAAAFAIPAFVLWAWPEVAQRRFGGMRRADGSGARG